MGNPPKELTDQIEMLKKVIIEVNVVLDANKIKVENYGKDFLKPLAELRKKALDLRSDLEAFTGYMEEAIAEQYNKPAPSRFASAKRVIDGFLSGSKE